ncbi:MAG: DMT family transporter [Brevinema sp.]
MIKIYFAPFLLLISSIIWGLAYIPTRFLGQMNFGVFFELLWRFSIPTLILGLIFNRRIRAMSSKSRTNSLLAGLVLFIGLFCAVQGLRTVSSPTVGFFLLSLNTILIPIYSLVRYGKRPSGLILFASIGATAGSILMAWGDPRVPPNFGTLLCFLSTIAFSAYIILCSHIAKNIIPQGLLFYHCLSFVVISIPLFLLFELQGVKEMGASIWSNPHLWQSVLYQGIGSGTIAYLLYFYGMKHTPAAAAAIILAMQSVVGASAEYFIFGVRLNSLTLIGCDLILVSTLGVSLFPKYSR